MPIDCDSHQCPHVMQSRCVKCKREQYALIVWPLSHGDGQCAWCGEPGVPMLKAVAEEEPTDGGR